MQVSFRKRAIDYGALLRKMTYPDKASYGSSTPCSTPQHTEAYCIFVVQGHEQLLHSATHCITLQHTTYARDALDNPYDILVVQGQWLLQHTASQCNTLQHTATLCKTLQLTATHCIIVVQGHLHPKHPVTHAATHCSTLYARNKYDRQFFWDCRCTGANICNTLQRTATHCSALQCTAMQCNAL